MNIDVRYGILFLFVPVLYAAPAHADGHITHQPGPYKMSKFKNTGENIPLNGPVIHVFSGNGKNYTAIANDNQNLTHTSTIGGLCGRRSQDFTAAALIVGGKSKAVSGTGSYAMKTHTESVKFPFMLPDIARSPVAACNFELDKRTAQGNKSREYWMGRGFVVKYENAYDAKFTASCGGVASRGDFKSKTIQTPVWIACAPVGNDARPDKNPARMAPSRARPVPLKVSATLEATEQGTIYAPECPRRITYSGSIWVSRPGTKVTYQIIGSNWDSPERAMTFKTAGRQNITSWTQHYREKKQGTGRLAAASTPADKQPDASGIVRLKVRYDGGSTQSDAISYKVFCNTEAPRRMRLKTSE